MSILEEASAIYERLAEKSDHCLVAYSGGKDSMVVLDYAARYFKRVDAFFMCIALMDRASNGRLNT